MVKQSFIPKSATRGTRHEGSVMSGSEVRPTHVHYQKMLVFDQSGEMHYAPDPFAAALLADYKPDWVPAELLFEMTDSLIGFTPEMALVIADDLIDCWSGVGMHLTGCQHIDSILTHFYAEILMCAFKKGLKLVSL